MVFLIMDEFNRIHENHIHWNGDHGRLKWLLQLCHFLHGEY